MTQTFNKIQMQQIKEQGKQRDEMGKRISANAKKLNEWLIEQGFTLGDTLFMLQAVKEGFDQLLIAKSRPLMDECKKQTLKQFYAIDNPPDAEAAGVTGDGSGDDTKASVT